MGQKCCGSTASPEELRDSRKRRSDSDPVPLGERAPEDQINIFKDRIRNFINSNHV